MKGETSLMYSYNGIFFSHKKEWSTLWMNLENIIVCGRNQTTRRGKSVETGSRWVVAKGWGLAGWRENEKWLLREHGVQHENVLELRHSRDGCAAPNILNVLTLNTRYMCECLCAQSCPTLFDPMDCSLPGSSVHRISPGKNTRVGCHVLL